MEFAVAIFTGLFLLLITDFFTPETPPKTSEEEIGEAITKYLAAMNKAGDDQKNAKK